MATSPPPRNSDGQPHAYTRGDRIIVRLKSTDAPGVIVGVLPNHRYEVIPDNDEARSDFLRKNLKPTIFRLKP